MTDREPFWHRYRDLVRRRPTDDVDDEIRHHLEMRREEALRAGLDPERADAIARERFGDVEGVAAELYAIDTSRERKRSRHDWFSDVARDIRFAWRSLVRAPSFAITTILTLALAIGANTTIFSFVHALLLAPLPFREPDDLVNIQANIVGSTGEMLALRERTTVFADIALFRNRSITFNDDRDAARLDGVAITPNLLRMLGVRPALGAAFDDDASRPGAGNVILLSHSLWRERYGEDSRVVGRSAVVDGVSHSIAGVMPATFHFPSVETRFWTPVTIDPGNITATWALGGSGFVARLKPGVSTAQADAELQAVVPGMRRLNPRWDPGDQYGIPATAQPLQESLISTERPALLLLMACVAVVLLVACANIANLMLARVTVREREFAVRVALGGGRGRLIRQLLTESVVTAAIGGALGVLISLGGVRWGVAALPETMVRTAEVHVNTAVLLFTAALTMLTGIAFGILPALRAASTGASGGAVRHGRGSIGGRSQHRLSGVLVASEVALAVLLAIVAGLLTRSFDQLRGLSAGFQTEQVVSARISPPPAVYGGANRAHTSAFYEQVIERMEAMPGVSGVGLVDQLPIAAPVFGMGVRIQGRFEDGTQLLPMANHVQTITPGYLRALGIPILSGRSLEDGDREDAPPVALVSQSFARRFWPDDDPIGKHIGYPYPSPWITVVGVVPDVKLDSLRDTSGVAVLLPFAQRAPRSFAPPEMFLVVRSTADPDAIARQLRDVVGSIDRTVPVTSVRAMSEVLARSVERPRFTTSLVALFALSTLLLGATGIYGVMSYVVSQRAQELGVRVALGATPRDIGRLIIGRGAALAVAGAVAGCVMALATTRLLGSLLYDVSATDPLTFGAAVVLFLGTAMLASAGPARRATRADPVETLRGS
ncbi:MAG TPA: ABC transporter permease [Gemmatimonadaceae bacterium]|nr:ABC transporter permease [Gemmatimonadaceae bacterium]